MCWVCEIFRRTPRNLWKKICGGCRLRKPPVCCCFKGGFGKSGILWWCFCGEFVVDCVVNVVRWMVISRRWKTCQLSEIYFFQGSRLGGDGLTNLRWMRLMLDRTLPGIQSLEHVVAEISGSTSVHGRARVGAAGSPDLRVRNRCAG